MLNITKDNFEYEVVRSDKLVVIDFWAPWCMPCKMIAPAVEELAKELAAKVKVGKVNVDESPDIANDFSILNIPTILFLKGGTEVSRMIGVNSKEAIKAKIDKALG